MMKRLNGPVSGRRKVLRAMLLLRLLISGPAQAESSQMEVGVDNFTFTPAEISVAAGTRVTWSNHDDIPHTVTDAASARGVKSPVLDTGDSFAYVFSHSGTFHYFCSLHPHMQGTVIVK